MGVILTMQLIILNNHFYFISCLEDFGFLYLNIINISVWLLIFPIVNIINNCLDLVKWISLKHYL